MAAIQALPRSLYPGGVHEYAFTNHTEIDIMEASHDAKQCDPSNSKKEYYIYIETISAVVMRFIPWCIIGGLSITTYMTLKKHDEDTSILAHQVNKADYILLLYIAPKKPEDIELYNSSRPIPICNFQ